MSGGIYLMRDDGELVEMNERGYDTEALLPRLQGVREHLLGHRTHELEMVLKTDY